MDTKQRDNNEKIIKNIKKYQIACMTLLLVQKTSGLNTCCSAHFLVLQSCLSRTFECKCCIDYSWYSAILSHSYTKSWFCLCKMTWLIKQNIMSILFEIHNNYSDLLEQNRKGSIWLVVKFIFTFGRTCRALRLLKNFNLYVTKGIGIVKKVTPSFRSHKRQKGLLLYSAAFLYILFHYKWTWLVI